MSDPAAIACDAVPGQRGSLYPPEFAARVGERIRQRLGNAFGLTQFGVNLTTLGPGAQSALRHWHSREDEFVLVLEGELWLVTDAGEQRLTAGMCVGFPAGRADGHHLLNRSAALARYVEIGSRIAGDEAQYPDDDLALCSTPSGRAFFHKDGRPY